MAPQPYALAMKHSNCPPFGTSQDTYGPATGTNPFTEGLGHDRRAGRPSTRRNVSSDNIIVGASDHVGDVGLPITLAPGEAIVRKPFPGKHPNEEIVR